MTKTLTEQFRDGSFECGVYYCKVKDDGEEETKKLLLYHDGCEHGYAQQFGYEEDFPYEDILEVLAPVPDYQTWKAFQQHFVDKTELEVKLKKAYEQLEQQSIKVVELQEQLEDANAIIEDMRPFIQASMKRETFARILHYEDKWGVK